MKTEIITSTKLTASEGHILTNGKVYGRIILLPNSVENDYYEITESEYESILAAQEQENGIVEE